MAEVDDILRDQSQMEADRANWDSLWSEVAKRVLPYQDEFNQKNTPGEKQGDYQFDSTATLALDRFVAAINDMLTPASRRWHGLVGEDAYLKDSPEVKTYLEAVRDRLFGVRYAPGANFSSNMAEVYKSLGAFGTGVLFVDEHKGHGIRYRQVFLGQVYLAENHQGRVDKVHRKFEYTARQAVQRFKDKTPTKIAQMAEKEPERKFTFIHCVKPNEDMKAGRKDYQGMKYASYYLCPETKDIIDRSGYRTMPYIVGRYSASLNSPYGISVAINALPDIKTLNEQEKTILRAAHRVVDPVLLAHEDGALSAFRMTPGAMNYGAVDDQGRPMVMPLQTGANIPLGLELSDQRRAAINDAFLVTIFQILVEEQRQMTATEVMQRAAEKGALLGPPMGRLQSELLGPLIERELDILGTAGVLEDLGAMPEALKQAGGMYEVEYTSELARLQKASDGVAIQRTLESIIPLAQIDPSVLSGFDIKGMAAVLAEVNGVPAKVIKSEEQRAEEEEAQKSAAAAQQALEAAPLLGKTAVDMANAQAISASSPNSMLPGIFPGI
jgi:hypothetical protein